MDFDFSSKKIAFLVSELANPNVPLLYLCEDEVYDDFGRLIWHANLTVGCDLFKCNKTFIMNQGSESRPKVDCESERWRIFFRLKLRSENGFVFCQNLFKITKFLTGLMKNNAFYAS